MSTKYLGCSSDVEFKNVGRGECGIGFESSAQQSLSLFSERQSY
jgi:hypothetical protein